MRSCLVGFSIAFVLACAAIGCQPYPTPTPQPPAPIVVPDVVVPVPSPTPVGPRVSFVLDSSGKVVDAPSLIQACEVPGRFTVYSSDRLPITVVVGDDSPVPPSPVPPQPPVPGIAGEMTKATRDYLASRADAFDDLADAPPATGTKLVEAINATAIEPRDKWDEALRRVLAAELPIGDKDQLPPNVASVLRAIAAGYRGAAK